MRLCWKKESCSWGRQRDRAVVLLWRAGGKGEPGIRRHRPGGCPGRECHVSRASPLHAGGRAEGEGLSGPDGSLTPVGYRDAGVWRQGVRWA
ncbi:hypothetical protein DESPIG_00243 [Desulfovibrio piger ATCC 29098]|uniref:Uncharacterized protein n=1 Tax=Desulfovibrio piger ATCC 29098 TaxID=411464 RepID=B6WQB9_9BACT|nr:hypothetical protein DESPIG_00243 [Desulfovibrio piger ATCC 29098]